MPEKVEQADKPKSEVAPVEATQEEEEKNEDKPAEEKDAGEVKKEQTDGAKDVGEAAKAAQNTNDRVSSRARCG